MIETLWASRVDVFVGVGVMLSDYFVIFANYTLLSLFDISFLYVFMLTTIDHIVSLLSSMAIATAVAVLTMVHIPQKVRWEPLSRARWILVVTFSILAISGLFKIDSSTPHLLTTVTLSVASYQALLFTHTALIMLTRSKSFRNTLVPLLLITFVTILLFVTKQYLPAIYPFVWWAAALAYCAQLVIHTITFRRQVKETAVELEDFYDEDVEYHLRPIKKFYYSALGIGVFAAIAAMAPLHHWGYNAFVIIYTLYYVYVVVAMMNYCIDGDFFLVPAEDLSQAGSGLNISLQTMKDSMSDGDSAENSVGGVKITQTVLEKALEEWVERREFTKVDVNTDEVAKLLCVTRRQLAAYFKSVHNTTFRSWRQQLRLEYARRLIRECPDLQMSHLHEQVGFNDRSNFYNAFRRYTGKTPQEYKQNPE